MLRFLKQVWLLALIGLLLLSLIVWFGGPYLALGSFKPFESTTGRLIGILVLVVCWAVWLQLRALRAQRSNNNLAAAVVAPSEGAGAAGAAGGESPDARQLRERFTEAVETLRKSRGTNLYDLPWYVIIGPPGSGKTTALVNSGLRFPLAQKFGAGALRGVGGTRNCDWWFTDQAVLLDTAGRYTTQDSDAAADSAGWAEFLKLLKRYRGRRPINGILVAMSASDLILLDDRARAAHVAAVRRRLEELNRSLKIRLPVYFLVTKCDLVAGFTEYFDELAQDGRAQVWGTTFPIEQSENGAAAAGFGADFDALITRLHERLVGRIETDRDPRRRAAILAFPQQMASLRSALTAFVGEAFSATTYDASVLLRGVYFTSGTQESTPIDRMMGSIARTFGLDAQAVAPAPTGRSYFIERLLRDVVIPEAGLAGVNRRLELRLLGLQYAGYAACLLLGVLGLAALLLSNAGNRNYLQQVSAALTAYEQAPAPAGAVSAAGIAETLPRLNALRDVVKTAEQYRSDRPWRVRWGLYQGGNVGEAARDAYIRTLSRSLLPALGERFSMCLRASTAQPELLYECLKAYLMLSRPEKLDGDLIGYLATQEWQRLFPRDPDVRDQLQEHFAALLEDKGRLQPLAEDKDLVAGARDSLRDRSLSLVMYSNLKQEYGSNRKHKPLRPDVMAGLGSESVLVRVSGTKLSEPLPALYTKAVFDEIQTSGKAALLLRFEANRWVLDNVAPSPQELPRIMREVNELYENDYILAWDALLLDVRPRPTNGDQDTAKLWRQLSHPTGSPLKKFYVAVEKQTNLLRKDPESAAAAAASAAAAAKAKAMVGATLGGLASQMVGGDGASSDPDDVPGAKVTRHFEHYHQLVDGGGGPAPIDDVLAKLGKIQQLTDQASRTDGGPAADQVKAGLSDAIRALQDEVTLQPPAFGQILAQLGEHGNTQAVTKDGSDLRRHYEEQVLRECRDAVKGRYPFGSGVDVQLADFGRLFGYGGVYDSFFSENLQSRVDTAPATWRWREGAGDAVNIPGILQRFQQAQLIRETFFTKQSAQQPEVRFKLTADDLDKSSSRFTLKMDGQELVYRNELPRPVSMAWPGPANGEATVSFGASGSAGENQAFTGPWAWFRLLESAQVQPRTETQYKLLFSINGRSASLDMEAATVRNPFARPKWKLFRCD